MSFQTIPFIYINDCFYHGEANATVRAAGRIAACRTSFNFVPVSLREEPNTLAFQLEEVLQTSQGEKMVIGANLASRDIIQHIKSNHLNIENGLPFVAFWYMQTLVITTANPEVIRTIMNLSASGALVDQNNSPVSHIAVLEIADVLNIIPSHYYYTNSARIQGKTEEEMKNYIIHTQFRSMYFVPLAADAIMQGDLPLEKLKNIPLAQLDSEFSSQYSKYWPKKSIHYIDNFGNCKTGLRADDINFVPGSKYEVSFEDFGTIELTAYSRLTDVPSKQPALIPGSSGFGYDRNSRRLEFVINGEPFASRVFSGMKLVSLEEGARFEIRKID